MRFLGFLIGFAAVVALECLFLASFHLVPRGPGWLVMPIMGGIGLSRATPALLASVRGASVNHSFFGLSRAARTLVVGSVIWLLAVPAYVFLFNPYGDDMWEDDYFHMLKVMIFPVAVAAIGYFSYARFVIGPNETKGQSAASTPAPAQELELQPSPAPAPAAAIPEAKRRPGDRTSEVAYLVQLGLADFPQCDYLVRAHGGRIEAKGFIFGAHYLIHFKGASHRVERMQGIHRWIQDNLLPKPAIES